MLIRNVVSTLALAACTLAPISSRAASIFGRAASSPSTPAAEKVKMIKFTLSNKTASPMTVMVNKQPLVLAANSSTEVRAADGSDILAEDGSTVKVHVRGDLSGNTVSFR